MFIKKTVWFLEDLKGQTRAVIFNKAVNFERARFTWLRSLLPTATTTEVLEWGRNEDTSS